MAKPFFLLSTVNHIYDIPMTGLVIQSVDHITTQDQEDGWLVFANRVGNKIREVPNAFHILAAITGVDGNEDYSDETDVREDPKWQGR